MASRELRSDASGSSAGVTLPPVGSVWREHDGRFQRFIKVIGWQDMRDNPRVIIQTVTADDGRAVTGRATRASPAAFGKRYRHHPTPDPIEAEAESAIGMEQRQ